MLYGVMARQVQWLGEVQATPATTTQSSNGNGSLTAFEKILLASVIVSAASLLFNVWSVSREITKNSGNS